MIVDSKILRCEKRHARVAPCRPHGRSTTKCDWPRFAERGCRRASLL